MARCEGCIHFDVCEALEKGNGLMKVHPIYCGFYKPTADVAPRAEVARKIFDEIHKIRSFGIYYNCAIINLDRLAEIEKKYTGESHD